MSNKGMSEEMYNFIQGNLALVSVKPNEGVIITPRGTNGTLCSSTGYLRVKVNGKVLQVHQVLAVVYFGSDCIGKQINHKDGNKINNKLDNLETCSREENLAHAWDTGLFKNSLGNVPAGHLNPNSKLLYDDVIYIRESGETTKELAKKYNMSVRNINAVKSRQTYKNID